MLVALSISIFFLQLSITLQKPSGLHEPRQASSRSPINSPIRSLFAVPKDNPLVYPPTDVKGPRPRDLWVRAYQRAKSAGLIPAIPPSILVSGTATYPATYRQDPCNHGESRCNRTSDIIHGPPGIAGINFDDGPQPPSLDLLQFLESQSQKATHFLIGSRILSNLATFRKMDEQNEHFAIHTYSHPMMTSLTDEEIVGELGWTMQVIHDKSRNNVICSHFRPPYGDLDDRVRAIAQHVFGLQVVLWGFDGRDWCLADSTPNRSACAVGNGPQTLEELRNTLMTFVNTDKRKGLIILHHEQSVRAIQGFKDIFPVMKRVGWITKTIPDMLNQPWYQASN